MDTNDYDDIIADAATAGGKYDPIEGYFPSGIQTPPHRHTRYSEQVYVLEGEITVWAGADKHLTADDLKRIEAVAPKGVAAGVGGAYRSL